MNLDTLVNDAFAKATLSTEELLAAWNDESNAPVRNMLAALENAELARVEVSVLGHTNIPSLKVHITQIDKFTDYSIGRKTPLTPLGDFEIEMKLSAFGDFYKLRNNVLKTSPCSETSTYVLYPKLWAILSEFRASDLVLRDLHAALARAVPELSKLQTAFERAAEPRDQLRTLWDSEANASFRKLLSVACSIDGVTTKVAVDEGLAKPWLYIQLSKTEAGDNRRTLRLSIGPGDRTIGYNFNMRFNGEPAGLYTTSPYGAHANLWAQLAKFSNSEQFLPAIHQALKVA